MTSLAVATVLSVLALAVLAYAAAKARAFARGLEARLDRIAEAKAAGGAAREEDAAIRDAAAAIGQDLAAARRELAEIARVATHQTQVTQAVRRDLVRLHAASRTTVFLANRIVIGHLDALGAQPCAPARLSYGFEAATRAVRPEVARRGSGRTVVCSLALGEAYRAKVQPALDSHRDYARARGLSYAVLQEPPSWSDRPPAWMKIPLIHALLRQGFARVVYIDADALVTNPAFDVEEVFGPAAPEGRITLTEDEAGINCGVMFIEDGPAIRRVLDLVWLFDADLTQGTWEQFALKSLMSLSGDVGRHVAIEPDPRRFNSFAPERSRFFRTMERSIWQPGDFLCHFSGIRSPHLEDLVAAHAARLARAG
jgi:hypothetical protein